MADIYSQFDSSTRPVSYPSVYPGQPAALDGPAPAHSQQAAGQAPSPATHEHENAQRDDGEQAQNRSGEGKTETKPQATFLTKLYACVG